jgi:hypothetical protein
MVVARGSPSSLIQAILEHLIPGALASFEQGQVIRVEYDHRFSSSGVPWAGMTLAT